jgi:hypothetical protein
MSQEQFQRLVSKTIDNINKSYEWLEQQMMRFRGEQGRMYAHHQEAVRHYNEEHKQAPLTEDEQLTKWDEVFVKKMQEGI